jgi:hypothetical protein
MKFHKEILFYLWKHQKYKCALTGKGIPESYLYVDFGQNKIDMQHCVHKERTGKRRWRAKKFYLMIDSLLNLKLYYHYAHMNNPSADKITDYRAEKIQIFLENPAHWKWRVFVNEVRWPEDWEDHNQLLKAA